MRIRLNSHRNRGRRLLAATIAAMIVGGAGAAMGAATASADTPPVIELSPDGIVWGTSLAGGLFDGFQGAVPGDTVTESFFVRNPLTTPVTMRTRAMDVVTASPQFADSITVEGTAGGNTLAAPVKLASLANCSTLAPDLIVGAKTTAKVTITLSMLNVSGSYAQSTGGGFDVLLSMEDAEAGTGATSCDSTDPTGPTDPTGGGGGHHHPTTPTTPTDPTGPTTASNPIFTAGSPLAFTGADIALPLAAAALMLLAGFLFLVARRRRRERRES
jgi:hypothetical protein